MRDILLGLIGCAALGLVAAAAGCGDTVTNGGTGGGGASSGTSSGTGGGQVTCEQACQKLAEAGCGDAAGCTTDCQGSLDAAPECQTQFGQILGCIAENAGMGAGCKPAACSQAEDDLDACLDGPGCDPPPCIAAADGSCECANFCGDQLIRAACQPNPDMTASCTCFSGDVEVGTCMDQTTMPACDLTAGCCASYFGNGGP